MDKSKPQAAFVPSSSLSDSWRPQDHLDKSPSTQFIHKALKHYKARLAEETERFGVQAAEDTFDEGLDPDVLSDMNVWEKLGDQMGLKFVVNDVGANVLFFVIAKHEIPRPHEYYKLWYAVEYLGTEPDDPSDEKYHRDEQIDFLHHYDGPYKLEVPDTVFAG